MSEFTSKDPAEILAATPKYPNREDTLKSVQDKFPGHIVWASDRGSFSGNRLVTFMEGGAQGLEQEDALLFVEQMKIAHMDITASPEDVANLYFSLRANLLVVNLTTSETTITMLITTQLDDDDLAEFQEVTTRVQLGMREWREARAQQKLADQAAILEERRLAEVGRKYEQNVSKKKQPENG